MQRDCSSSGSEHGMVTCHALSASATHPLDSWILDSGATCHMCNDKGLFAEFVSLKSPLVGDGHILQAIGRGKVSMQMKLSGRKRSKCKLHDVLHVPKLSYNLFSVSKAAEAGKVTRFNESGCQILGAKQRLIATGTRVGSLYYLGHQTSSHQVHAVTNGSQEKNEDVWHRHYGHLGMRNLRKLAKDNLVDDFDYDTTKEVSFCEPCANGKHHRSSFPTSGAKRAEEPLGLVHSDVCGKMGEKSLSGSEYFLTFVDDKTCHVWVYILKHKYQVFEQFLEWKALVKRSTGCRLKALCTHNGGEFTSTEFKDCLKREGIQHELSVPKTPEQNGVAERLNRTLVESVRSMLSDAKLPQKFWAEALSTAVYLQNRSPTKAVTGMTPFEAWSGEKPGRNFMQKPKSVSCWATALRRRDIDYMTQAVQ